MDRSKIQFDVLSIETEYMQAYHSLFEELGTRIFYMPAALGPRLYYVYRLLRKQEYDYVHSHVELPSAVYLAIAKLVGTKQRIAHGHLGVKNEGIKNRILTYMLNKVVTTRWAASELAIQSLFGPRFVGKSTVIKNAIEVEKYKFDEEVRRGYREMLGLEGCYVVGFVGRLTQLKNVFYLLDVFAALNDRISNALLLIVGDGELKEEMEDRIAALGITEKVRFLGNRSDVHNLMMAMDISLLPSYQEGLGIVLIEAQAAALKSIANSAGIPASAKVTPYLLFEDIRDAPQVWVNRILSEGLNYVRVDTSQEITEEGYNVSVEADRLLQLYTDGLH